MLEHHTEEIELTPEQRRQLGHVYRLILSWRRERRNNTKASSHPVTTQGETGFVTTDIEHDSESETEN